MHALHLYILQINLHQYNCLGSMLLHEIDIIDTCYWLLEIVLIFVYSWQTSSEKIMFHPGILNSLKKWINHPWTRPKKVKGHSNIECCVCHCGRPRENCPSVHRRTTTKIFFYVVTITRLQAIINYVLDLPSIYWNVERMMRILFNKVPTI